MISFEIHAGTGEIVQKFTGFFKRVGMSVVKYVRSTYIALWLVLLCCSVFSCMLVYSATHDVGTRTLIVQIAACLIGYTGAVIISSMDYERLGELWYLIAIVCVGLIFATYIFGERVNELADDRAWLNIFGVSFQPSELVKIGFIVTFSYHLSITVKAGHINSFPHILLLVAHALVPIGMIIIQGDTGTAMVFMFMFGIMIFSSGINWKYILGVLVAALAALPILWQQLPTFQKERIRVVYFPQEGDELDQLYQQTLGRIAYGSGGITGQGWMKGRMVQSDIIPEDYNDFIFTVAGEEFGLIGCSLIIILELAIILLTLRVAFSARDSMGRFICIGFFSMVATQCIFNIGMVLVVLPVIGITLPFFSAGGSSSMCLYFGFGLVLSVYMRRNEAKLRV